MHVNLWQVIPLKVEIEGCEFEDNLWDKYVMDRGLASDQFNITLKYLDLKGTQFTVVILDDFWREVLKDIFFHSSKQERQNLPMESFHSQNTLRVCDSKIVKIKISLMWAWTQV